MPLNITSTTFAVHGEVRTNERARHGKGFTYTPAKTKAARQEIVQAFRCAVGSGWSPHEGPLRMEVYAQHACQEKDLWPGRFCRRKPDLDNVVKLVGDALNGVAYLDDAQIVEVKASKGYGKSSKIEVRLSFEEPKEKPRNGWEKVREGLWRLWRMGQHGGWVVKVGRSYCGTLQQDEPEVMTFDCHTIPFGTLAEAKSCMENPAATRWASASG